MTYYYIRKGKTSRVNRFIKCYRGRTPCCLLEIPWALLFAPISIRSKLFFFGFSFSVDELHLNIQIGVWEFDRSETLFKEKEAFPHNTLTFWWNWLLLLGSIRYGNEFKSCPSLVFVSGLNTISDFPSLFNYCTAYTALVPLRIRKTNRHLSSSPSFRRCIINRRTYVRTHKWKKRK